MRNIIKATLYLAISILFIETSYAIEKNPPIGSFPSKPLNVSFLFEEDNKTFLPAIISYKGKEGIELSSFPTGKIKVFVKVEQSTLQEEGAVMYKLSRVYRSGVMYERRGKVRLWTGKNFYKNTGIIQENWEETKYQPHSFKLEQINNYSDGIPVDGVRNALSLSLNRSKSGMLSNKNMRKCLAIYSTDELNKSLFTIGFIHFSAFGGIRWLPIDVFVSEESGNLKDVFLDIFLIKESGVTVIGRYWIGVK